MPAYPNPEPMSRLGREARRTLTRAAVRTLISAVLATALVVPATLPATASTEVLNSAATATATGSGTITGKVTLDDGRPLAGGFVWAWDWGMDAPMSTTTAADGSYRITGLMADKYTLQFEPGDGADQIDAVPEFWKDAYFQSKATYFTMASGQARTGMNAQLARGSTVSGRVIGPDGQPPAMVDVNLVALDGETVDLDNSVGELAADGTYTIRRIPAGTWTLQFWGTGAAGEGYVTEYWGNRPYRSQATFLTFTPGSVRKNMNAELIKGGSMSGRVTGPDRLPVAGATVHLESFQTAATGVKNNEAWLSGTTDANGEYSIMAVPPGLWVLYFYAPEGSKLKDEWWSERPWGNGDPIQVLPQAAVTQRNATLSSATPSRTWGAVSRIAGPDRYATAARISASQFAPGVATAYIASGTSFPDALAAAPVAAAARGPVLLTPTDSLPSVVAAELRRLQPRNIVVLGGGIRASVVTKLASFTSGRVTRIAGSNRYATSAALSKSRFSPGVPVVYLVSGTSFPDGLAAAPQAALGGAPILLVERNRIDPSVIAELKRLRPEVVKIIGGGTVSPETHAQIDALALSYSIRFYGRDRYETSAIMSAWFEPGVSVAYVTSGENFPDALAAGPVAGLTSGPVLLTRRDTLPQSVADELRRLRPERIVVLGSPGAVSTAVEAKLRSLSK
ncbi:hypothetical protein ASE68_14410 [Agromyces sp. Leaf222]|nr:hypothetical protein ASE68_14410 [Agromyces sp. Leaf222]